MSRLSVGAATINWGSYGQSQDHCQWRQLSHQSSPGVYIEPPGLLQRNIARLADRLMRRLQSVQNAATHTADNWCTTARSDHMDTATAPLPTSTNDVSTSKSPSWFSSAWLVRHLVNLRRTVSSSPTSALADFDQQTQGLLSRAARPTSSATDASQLPVHGYGTRFQSKTVSQSGTIQAVVKEIPV